MTLKQLRVAKGLSQAALASMIGACNSSIVSHWECGKTIPRFEFYDKLVELLGGVPSDIPHSCRGGRPIGS